MKKIVLSVLFIILISLSLFLIINNYKKEDNVSNGYYIYMYDDTIPGGSYLLEISENGKCNLKVENFSSAIDIKNSKEVYNSTLTEDEFLKIKKILKYINRKYNFKDKENYAFYFDYNKDAEKISRDDLDILLYTINAIESILMGDEVIENQTRKEFGNEWLDNIIRKLNI